MSKQEIFPENSTSNQTGSSSLTNDVETIKNDLEFIKSESRDMKISFEKERQNTMSVFGIFATIVIFLVTEIAVIKTADNISQLIGLSLILLSSLLLFSFFLNKFLNSSYKVKISNVFCYKTYENMEIDLLSLFFITIIFFLFILGIYFSNEGINFNNHNIKQNIKLEIN